MSLSNPENEITLRINQRESTAVGSQSLLTLLLLFYVILFAILKLWDHSFEYPHALFLSSLFVFYFLCAQTRQFLVLGIPFIAYATIYDFSRYIPFEWYQPIFVQQPYQADLSLFGVSWEGALIPFHEFILRVCEHPIFDFFTGAIYLLHLPVTLIMLLVTYKFHSRQLAQRYSLAFLLMNIMAFLTYFLYPSAAPWYVEKYGFLQPQGLIPGSAAGLVKFDHIFGTQFFTHGYQISSVVFGAIPSMHSGFATLAWLYSFSVSKKLAAFFSIYLLGMYFSAVYLQHHYLIDVVIGIGYAFVAYLVIEKLLQRPVDRLHQGLQNAFMNGKRHYLFGRGNQSD